MLISCSEKKDSNNSKENENSDSEKKAIELVLEKEVENKTLSSNSEEETSQKETDEALGGEIEGDIITGIKDKIYFYESSNLDSKTSSYFLKGQKAEYLEISDDDLEDDFLYVNFEYKGKVMTGYVLKSDVKFD